MKRDMDLVRRIALEVADLPHGKMLDGLSGVDGQVFALHATWMEEAGLVKANITTYLEGTSAASIFRLTWDGCEFADAVRSDTVWKKAKENVIKPTTSFTFGLLKEWLSAEIRDGFPSLR